MQKMKKRILLLFDIANLSPYIKNITLFKFICYFGSLFVYFVFKIQILKPFCQHKSLEEYKNFYYCRYILVRIDKKGFTGYKKLLEFNV